MAERLVVGVGNPDRGDDAVGFEVVRLLAGRVPPDVRLIAQHGEATALVALFEQTRQVWLIDAALPVSCHGLACHPRKGVHRIDCAADDAIVPQGAVSSHGFGVAEAIALARALGALPPHCIVYAIEAADFTAGAPLSPVVARAAHEIAERILAELATQQQPSAQLQQHPAPATDHR